MKKSIIVENISKTYAVSSSQKIMNFREMLLTQVYSLWSTYQTLDQFYALKNISFSVNQGEVIGIIGKNGSGKSTLLKILSKVTRPCSGRVRLQGRVASLLEVGTGFHPELTGRENIFLSGIILGMKRWEIHQNFNEIVSFAGVEKFLDVPVKRYSSGMSLRLAFSIMAHLQPEILIIDEVLAVGDYEFEKKCLRVMGDISSQGKTIVFVSHNIEVVKRLCKRVFLLEKGELVEQGDPQDVIDLYLGYSKIGSYGVTWEETNSPGDDFISLRSVEIVNESFTSSAYFKNNKPLFVKINYKIKKDGARISLILSFFNQHNELLFTGFEALAAEVGGRIRTQGCYQTICEVPSHLFQDGTIYVSVAAVNAGIEGEMLESNLIIDLPKVVSFKVISEDEKVEGFIWSGADGLVRPNLNWNVQKRNNI